MQFRKEDKNLFGKQFDESGNLTAFSFSAVRSNRAIQKDTWTFKIVSSDVLRVLVPGVNARSERWVHIPFQSVAEPEAALLDAELLLLSEAQRDVLAAILNGTKTRRNVELVVAAYSENLTWAHMYGDIATVYVKGELVYAPVGGKNLSNVVRLPNVGRETHTYLHHIVSAWDRLADVTVFTQGQAPTQGYLGHRLGGGHMHCEVSLHDYILDHQSNGLFVFTEMIHLSNAFHGVRPEYFHHVCLQRKKAAKDRQFPAKCFGDKEKDIKFLSPMLHHPGTVHIIGDSCKAEHLQKACSPVAFWEKYIKLPLPEGLVTWYAQGAVFSATRTQIRRRSKQDYERLLEIASMGRDTSAGFFMEWFWYYLLVNEVQACPRSFSTAELTRQALAAPVESKLNFPDLSDFLRENSSSHAS